MNEKKIEKPKRAVALGFEQGKDEAPYVIASGTGKVAEKILELAVEHGVPLREDKELVEALAGLELGDAIPDELFAAVAEVLVFFEKVNRERKRA
ncbi:MAG TPA: hypothetical protein DD435_00185 [Cyanobacteria bacterium UBA8530]|nr:hypothetical protein [Cyanobacteria bacterium UBA8530]